MREHRLQRRNRHHETRTDQRSTGNGYDPRQPLAPEQANREPERPCEARFTPQSARQTRVRNHARSAPCKSRYVEARRGPPNSSKRRVVTHCTPRQERQKRARRDAAERTVVLTAAAPDHRAADSTAGNGKNAPR